MADFEEVRGPVDGPVFRAWNPAICQLCGGLGPPPAARRAHSWVIACPACDRYGVPPAEVPEGMARMVRRAGPMRARTGLRLGMLASIVLTLGAVLAGIAVVFGWVHPAWAAPAVAMAFNRWIVVAHRWTQVGQEDFPVCSMDKPPRRCARGGSRTSRPWCGVRRRSGAASAG